jgi:coproporphyrinogen III oxidase-like Fe-S oxidoreductase
VRRFEVAGEGEALLAKLDVGGSPVVLRFTPAGSGPAWARTRSLSIAIDSREAISALPERVERVLVLLRSLLEASDPGGLEIVIPEAPGADDAAEEVAAPSPIAALEQALGAEEVHRASYLAWLEPFYGLRRGPYAPAEAASVGEIQACWQSTLRERQEGRAPPELGLYVHVPFCAVACTFCHCSMTDRFSRAVFEAYGGAVLAELDDFAHLFAGHRFTSVNYGGGTPSLLSAAALDALMSGIHRRVDVEADAQITFEANPDSTDDEKIGVLARSGRVNRLSIGVQALDPEVQRRMRRHNRAEDVERCVKAARREGIGQVNIDLLAGLDGQSMESFVRDLERVVGFEPDRVHVVPFRVDPWTPFAQAGRKLSTSDEALRGEMLRHAEEFLAARGLGGTFEEATTTGSATENRQLASHRRGGSVLGLGVPAGSHAFAAGFYGINDPGPAMGKTLEAYATGARGYHIDRIDREEEGRRYLVDNLRRGVSLGIFREIFGRAPAEIAPHFDALIAAGLVVVGEDVARMVPADEAEYLLGRALLYGDALKARLWQIGKDYEPGQDYLARSRARYG